jgi:hypothetical protein
VRSWGLTARCWVNIQLVCAKSLVVTLGYLIVGPGRMLTGGGGWMACRGGCLPAARMSRFMIAKNDTQPCTLVPEVHGCV